MRRMNTIGRLYNKHKKLIYRLIADFASSGIVDPLELESRGHEIFLKCYKAWNPDRATFITLLYIALTNAFKSELMKAKRTHKREQGMPQKEILQLTPPPDSNGTDWLIDFLLQVSGDAQKIIFSLLTDEMTSSKYREAVSITKSDLKKELRKQGWEALRVNKAFAEIKQALRTR